ncbi:AAA family ATPase [Streptacidiphilus sp. MAP5-52]|uniref:AAA family ATPase n=1 Tax=Streptacidiphilus sp. MAP5-52 TaxID=3156267 RepID=UPI003518CEE7
MTDNPQPPGALGSRPLPGPGEQLLLVIRGNSGSGKSTIARRLREAYQERSLAIIDQDTVRRQILRERDTVDGANIDLLALMVSFALSRGYHVIVEGILNAERYGAMLERLHAEHDGPQHWYYLDIPFTETLRRHATRPLSETVTETEMSGWYRPGDLLPGHRETVIGPDSTLDQSVARILADTQLLARRSTSQQPEFVPGTTQESHR